MKLIGFFAVVLFLVFACAGNKSLSIQENDGEAKEDSVSYELIVLDPGFETWYATRANQANMRSLNYYENWNEQYVNAWNTQRMGYRYSQLIHGNIEYDPREDYGPEINHKLFYYFMYVENVLKIQLMPNGPSSY